MGESIQEHEGWSFVISYFPHKDVVFAHHLEVGTFPSNFLFPSIPGPFLEMIRSLDTPGK